MPYTMSFYLPGNIFSRGIPLTCQNHCVRLCFLLACIYLAVSPVAGQAPGNHAVEGHFQSGKDLYYEGEYKLALKQFHTGLQQLRELDSLHTEMGMNLYQRAANTYGKLRYQEQALAYLDSALNVCTKMYGESSSQAAGIYMDRGVIYSQMLKLSASTSSNQKALEIYKNLYGPESEKVGSILMHMAIDYYKLDEFEASEACYLRAKRIFDSVLSPDDENHNRIYNNMGMLYRKKKDYKKALEYAETALKFKLKHYPPRHPSVGKYYSNIARIHLAMGEPEKAIPYNQKELEIVGESYGLDHPEYGGGLAHLGEIYQRTGNTKKAFEVYGEAYTIIGNRLGPAHPYALASLTNQSLCLQEEGDLEGAVALVNKAITSMQKEGDRYFPHLFDNAIRLAVLFRLQGEFDRARQIADSLLRVLHLRGERPNSLGYAPEYRFLKTIALSERAEINFDQSEGKNIAMLTEAWKDYEQVTLFIEEMRREVTSDESQEYLFKEAQGTYADALEVATQLHRLTGKEQYLAAALEVSEMSKASILRQAMMERNARAMGGLPPQMATSLEEMDEKLYDLRSKMKNTDLDQEDSLAMWSRSVVKLEDDKLQLLKQIESEYPAFYKLKYADSKLNLPEVREKLDRDHRAFISYYLVGDEGHIYFLSKNHFRHFTFMWSDELSEWISDLRKGNIIASARQFDRKRTGLIYDMLWREVNELMEEEQIQRVTISPHQVLSYLPFELLTPGNSHGRKETWLVNDYAITYAYSLNALFVPHSNRDFAIPYAGFAPFNDSVTASMNYLAMRDDLVSLPASLEEVDKASKLFHGRAYLRQLADYKTFTSIAGSAAILHMATHATLNPEAPLESGFYLYPDEIDDEISSGRRFTIFEVYNSDIVADLVILSACQTGDGDLSAGEGPLSLARAFRYAGSNSVVMSHWRASDASTSEIVLRFLEEVSRGVPKDLALQRAKKEYLATADPLLAHPFFWAGISLYGDPGSIDTPAKANWLGYGLVGCVLLAGGIWFWRRRRSGGEGERV